MGNNVVLWHSLNENLNALTWLQGCIESSHKVAADSMCVKPLSIITHRYSSLPSQWLCFSLNK